MSSLTDSFNNMAAPLISSCQASNDKAAVLACYTELQAAANALSAQLAAYISALPE